METRADCADFVEKIYRHNRFQIYELTFLFVPLLLKTKQ